MRYRKSPAEHVVAISVHLNFLSFKVYPTNYSVELRNDIINII